MPNHPVAILTMPEFPEVSDQDTTDKQPTKNMLIFVCSYEEWYWVKVVVLPSFPLQAFSQAEVVQKWIKQAAELGASIHASATYLDLGRKGTSLSRDALTALFLGYWSICSVHQEASEPHLVALPWAPELLLPPSWWLLGISKLEKKVCLGFGSTLQYEIFKKGGRKSDHLNHKVF